MVDTPITLTLSKEEINTLFKALHHAETEVKHNINLMIIEESKDDYYCLLGKIDCLSLKIIGQKNAQAKKEVED